MNHLTPEIHLLMDCLASLSPAPLLDEPAVLTTPYQLRADKHCANARGLYALEYDKRGTSYRWTGPRDMVTFNLRLSRSMNWTVLFRLIATSDPRNLTQTQFFVNDSRVSLSSGGTSGMWFFQSEPFSTRHEMTVLRYVIPACVVPSEADPDCSDDRRLGVAWHDLRAIPESLG